METDVNLTRRSTLAAALALFATGASTATAQTGKAMTTPTGLQITDTKVGTGATPKTGQTCVMHYTGWLWVNGAKGAKFDSSHDRGQPFTFPIGQRRVIAGWDEGVASMKIGGKRTLLIPPQLGRDQQGPLAADLHARHALVPAPDHLALPD